MKRALMLCLTIALAGFACNKKKEEPKKENCPHARRGMLTHQQSAPILPQKEVIQQ